MRKAAEFRRQNLAPKIEKSYNQSVDLSETDFELDPEKQIIFWDKKNFWKFCHIVVAFIKL